MAKLIWAQKAIESLEAIYDYISRDSIQYANYQTRKIVESVERLSLFPESGKIIMELNNRCTDKLLLAHIVLFTGLMDRWTHYL